jgi:hypothetical protein
MSLMRLLSVSRSFCARVPDLGRYQMTGGMRLPRFGSAGKRAKPVVVATQVELPIAGTQASDAGDGLSDGVERRDGTRGTGAGLWRRWLTGWRRISAWLTRPATPRRPARRPVQTAFLLESVKVVRNDLADADMELMRMKKRRRAVTGEETAMRGLSTEGRPRQGLGRMAVRWLTAGRFS